MTKRTVQAKISVIGNRGFKSIEFWWGERANQRGIAYSRHNAITSARLDTAKLGTPDTYPTSSMIPADVLKACLEALR